MEFINRKATYRGRLEKRSKDWIRPDLEVLKEQGEKYPG